MALKTKVGAVSGSRSQPSLSVIVHETGAGPIVRSDALDAAINAAPVSILNAQLNTTDVGIVDQSDRVIAFQLNYGRRQSLTLTRSVAARTKPRRRFNFFSPRYVQSASGDVTSSYSWMKSKLNRSGSFAEFNAGKPIAVEPLAESRTVSYTTPLTFVNDTYINRVEEMVDAGVFNNAAFWGSALGELQLVSFTANEQTDGSWTLAFGMGRRVNETSLSVVDGISLPTLRGCDDYWPIEEEVFQDGSIQAKVKALVVGQQWELDDFNALNLPWQALLTSRTNATTGVLTTLYAHNITGSDTVAIYWDGGYRLNANVTGTTTFSISFSSGNGDVLPFAGSRVLVAKI